jgi:hypothetical protein
MLKVRDAVPSEVVPQRHRRVRQRATEEKTRSFI